ncbi:MAG TPA: chemotaxis protein CheC [Firmicutes bacterium]|nr:chemotaxis protein CheC [Bacillota bacterium]
MQDYFSALELDALKEVGTVGAGNAATVLASMLGQRVPMTVPEARLLPIALVPEVVGGAESEVVGVCLNVEGAAPAAILFLLPRPDGEALVRRLLGAMAPERIEFNDLERSALGEVTNILSGAYLQALSEFTGLSFVPSPPAFAHDMAGALLDNVFAEIGRVGDYALLIETEFMTGDQGVRGHFFLVPDPDGLTTILQALGVREWRPQDC